MQTIRSTPKLASARTVLVLRSSEGDFTIPLHPNTKGIIVVDVGTGLEAAVALPLGPVKKPLTSKLEIVE